MGRPHGQPWHCDLHAPRLAGVMLYLGNTMHERIFVGRQRWLHAAELLAPAALT